MFGQISNPFLLWEHFEKSINKQSFDSFLLEALGGRRRVKKDSRMVIALPFSLDFFLSDDSFNRSRNLLQLR